MMIDEFGACGGLNGAAIAADTSARLTCVRRIGLSLEVYSPPRAAALISSTLAACSRVEALTSSAPAALSALTTAMLKDGRADLLLVDAGVTVFASRNPRDDDPSNQGCGTLTTAGGACTALITGNCADGSAIMGSGVMEAAGARLCLIQ
jgi:hypothetical protein